MANSTSGSDPVCNHDRNMDINFAKYEVFDEVVNVKRRILFGDKSDTKIKKVHKKPTKSRGGTIIFELRPCTEAYEGEYVRSKVTHKSGQWFHLIHLKELNGEAIGRFLCTIDDYHPWKIENAWNRYDWCHGSNFGDTSSSEGETVEDKDPEVEVGKEKAPKRDFNIHFVSVDDDSKKMGKFVLSRDCIEGDWNYGLRLVDPKTKLAYAYAYGDSVINFYLGGGKLEPKGKKTDFNIRCRVFKYRN